MENTKILISIVDVFNRLNNEKTQVDFEAKVSEAALSGQDTGFIPRADQTGYQRLLEIQQSAEEEKEEEQFQLLMMAITALNDYINEGLFSIAETIEELYELAEKLLDDINDIHDQIIKIQGTHLKALKALSNHDDKILEHGIIENKTLQKMAENYCNRTGRELPKNSISLHVVINEQIYYEQNILIPWLETRSEKLVHLHDSVITDALEISNEHKSLSIQQDQVNDLPQSEEMAKQLQELDFVIQIERKEAEYLKDKASENKAKIEKEIEDVLRNNSVTPAELEEKVNVFSDVNDLDFDDTKKMSPVNLLKPGG